MCGIAGIWDKVARRNACELSAMCSDSIVHCGPDDEGVWCDAEAGLFFSHRRLSILDLAQGIVLVRSRCITVGLGIVSPLQAN